MKTWHFAVVGLLLFALAGCRSDPTRELLERELRRKEDEIYRLRWALEDMQDLCDGDARSSGDGWRPGNSTPRTRSDSAAPNGIAPPAIELPSRPSEKVPESLTPRGVPEVPEHLRGPSGPVLENGGEAPPARPNAEETSAMVPLLGEPISPSGDSRRVHSIALNPALTGGLGDAGVLAIVEPRDAEGRPVDAPAEVSVVVLDPAVTDAEGRAATVARWEYTVAETAEAFRLADSAPAMHLMMGWHETRPQHDKLHLFVRYVTEDGRKLQADMPIDISTPRERSSRWTPAELDRTEERVPLLEARRVESRPPPHAEPRPRPPAREAKMKRPVWSPERPR